MNDKEFRWRQMSFASCTVFQPVAYELGLTYNDGALLSWVHILGTLSKTKTIKKDGVVYSWVHYPTFLSRFPLMGIGATKSVTRIVNALCDKGVLLRHTTFDIVNKTMVYMAIPQELDEMLFLRDYAIDYIEEVFQKWEAYREAHGIALPVDNSAVLLEGEDESVSSLTMPPTSTDLFGVEKEKPPVEDKPIVQFTEDFLAFWDNVLPTTKFKHSLTNSKGEPTKGALEVQDMREAMLNGTFNVKYKPVSHKYDFAKLGKITNREIVDALETIPDYLTTLKDCFLTFQKKSSMILERVWVKRFGYIDPPKKQGADDATILADPDIQHFIKMVRGRYSLFDPKGDTLQNIYKLHLWYKKNADDFINDKELDPHNSFGTLVGKGGLKRLGDAVGNHIRNTNRVPEAKDFMLDSWWWKSFAQYCWKGWKCPILFDASIYRKIAERNDAKERLYEPRANDYDVDDFS